VRSQRALPIFYVLVLGMKPNALGAVALVA